MALREKVLKDFTVSEKHAAKMADNEAADKNLSVLSAFLSTALKNGARYETVLTTAAGSTLGTYDDVWKVYARGTRMQHRGWVLKDETEGDILKSLEYFALEIQAGNVTCI